MKKIMIIAATAALALIACTKFEKVENTDPENAVVFSAYSGKSTDTKATSSTDYGVINDLAALKGTTNGFGVFACYSENTSITPATYAEFKPSFMYNQQVTWSAGSSAWVYSPLKYWPNNNAAGSNGATTTDKLSFAAYAPYVATVGTEGITAFSANNATGAPTVSFKVPAAANEQIDLMYADATSLANLTKQTIGGHVILPFKHALTNLTLKVANIKDATTIPATDPVSASDKVDATETSIVVNSIQITSSTLKNTGTLNLATGAWSGEAAAAIDLSKSTMNEDVTACVSKASAAMLMEAMFVPSTSATITVKINYTVTTTDAKLEGGKSAITNEITNTTAAFNLDKGKKYTLYLGLGMTSVKLEATVESWSDGASQPDPIWLPINNS